MRIVAQFDPSTETKTTFYGGFTNGQGKIVVYNQSPNNLQLAWDAFSTYCPAWTAMLYCISSSTVNLNWVIQTTLTNAAAPPISQVTVEAFDPGETVMGTYPASLMHQTSIGNNVGTTVTATNAISNTTNAPLSNWLAVQPTDALTNTFTGDTSGNLTVKSDNTGTLTTLLQLIAGASPGVKLAAAAVLTEVLGTLQVDGAADFDSTVQIDGTLSINSTQGIIQAINSTSGGRIQIQNNAGGVIAQFDSGGITMGIGNVNFFEGAIARESRFTGTTTGTYTHNMTAAPNWVGPMQSAIGSQTMGYDSVGSTTVHVTSGAGNAFTAQCFR